jgi:hypothetical protein
MDPITIVVTAIAMGAAAAAKPMAEQAVKDGYAGLKALIQRKYASATDSLNQVEARPDSEARRAVLQEDLESGNVAEDEEVLRQVEALSEAIASHAPEVAAAIGVDLEDIKAGALRLKDIVASGTGVKVRKGEFSGDIEIEGVRAGQDLSKN